MSVATWDADELPVPAAARPGWSTARWGVVMVIATEGTLFVILVSAYLFLRATSTSWPPPGVEVPELRLAVPFSFVLWASSAPLFVVDAAAKRGRFGVVRAGLALTWLLGFVFLLWTAKDFRDLHFGWRDHAYGTAFYTVVGLHALHVVAGLAVGLVVQAKAWLGRYTARAHASLEVFSLYWHFVDVIWLVVFPTVFLGPRWR